MREQRKPDTATVLFEFTAVQSQRTFQASLPDRQSPHIITVDPLSLIGEMADSMAEYPARLASHIASCGFPKVKLCANCRGVALLAAVAHHLARTGIQTVEILAVDPVWVDSHTIVETMREIARNLNIADTEFTPTSEMTLDTAKTQLEIWIDRFIDESGVGAEDADSIRADLLGIYVRWLAYQFWAIELNPPRIECDRVAVLAAADPGPLDRIFDRATGWNLTCYGNNGQPVLEHPDVAKRIRDLAAL